MGTVKMLSDKRVKRYAFRMEKERTYQILEKKDKTTGEQKVKEEVTKIDRVWKVERTVPVDKSCGIGLQGMNKEQALAFYQNKYQHTFSAGILGLEFLALLNTSRRFRRATMRWYIKFNNHFKLLNQFTGETDGKV